jgi:hypothetical protein
MKLWTIKEIMQITGYGERTLHLAMRRGELRSMKMRSAMPSDRRRDGKSVQSRRYVKQDWLVAWLGYDPLAEPERAQREAEARRQKVAFVDRTGQRYGQLVAVSWERRQVKEANGQRAYRTQVFWLCRCDCGKTRELPSGWFSSYANRALELSCEGCSQAIEREKLSKAGKRRQEQGKLFVRQAARSPYEENYRQYREQFTAAQWARYEELMKGRKGWKHEAQAVDVVMREPQPGICCEKCLATNLQGRPGGIVKPQTRGRRRAA